MGFDIDLENGRVTVPPHKIECLKVLLKHLSSGLVVEAKQLASIIGKIIAMSLAVGPVSRLMTRSPYALLNTRASWCHRVKICPEGRREVKVWLCGIENFNGQDIWKSPSAVRIVYTDASNTG